MARNGSGTYSLPEAAFTYGYLIDEAAVNSNFSDIATALTGSIAADGQTVITANLPMSGFRHTGVGNASARDSYAAAGQVQDSALTWCGTAGGTADALTLTPTPSITAYAAGQTFRFIAASANTGAVAVAVSGLAAKAIQLNGSALSASDIESGKIYALTYDGTQFQLTRLSPAASLVASDIGTNVQAFDADTAKTNVAQTFSISQRGTVTIDNDASLDMSVTNNFSVTPTGSFTLQFTNETIGQSGLIYLNNTANRTCTLGAEIKGAANLATDLSATGTFVLSYFCYDGTNVAVAATEVS